MSLAPILSLLISAALAQAAADPPSQPSPNAGRYVEAPGYSPYAPGDPRAPDAPEPSGFRLNAKICAAAARQSDPLAQTAECQGILQAARDQAETCKRAFETGDDRVAMSAACRQAAMGR
jgi:hypothetical protein